MRVAFLQPPGQRTARRIVAAMMRHLASQMTLGIAQAVMLLLEKAILLCNPVTSSVAMLAMGLEAGVSASVVNQVVIQPLRIAALLGRSKVLYRGMRWRKMAPRVILSMERTMKVTMNVS